MLVIYMDNIIKLLQAKTLTIPEILITNYQKLDITTDELLIVIYLMNDNDKLFNPKQISHYFSLKLPDTLELINNLCDKGIIKIKVKKRGNVREEYLDLDGLYQKLSFLIIKKDEKTNESSIFSKFESEFGRTLSPIEYELINSWLENTTEELINLALKEAVYNGVTNLRYIDKIIHDWTKKGIKSEKDLIKQKTTIKKENNLTETFDYDWLNETGSNN